MTATIGCRGSESERFWSRVNKTDSCWLWTGSDNGVGYGQFYRAGGKKTYAHIFSYELHKGPIPAGLSLDHLCRVRNCCNPNHLEAVTHRENCLRGEGCHARHYRGEDCEGVDCRNCARFHHPGAEMTAAPVQA